MNNMFKNLAIWLVIGMVLMTVFNQFNTRQVATGSIEYSQFIEEVKQGRISKVVIEGRTLKATTTEGKRITTYAPPDLWLVSDLLKNGVKIEAKPEEEPSMLMNIFVSWFPMLLLIGVWVFFMRQMQGGGKGGAFSFGKSKARLLDESTNSITFADVAGCDEAKEEVSELVDFLRDPTKFQKLGGRIPKGVLLVGNPGTGKTLLAKAIAGEAKVPFFSISGSDFVEMFVGVGAARVRDLFEQARAKAPAIIFIDELDALGRARAAGGAMGGHDEKEQTLNQLLVELDGFDSGKGLVLLGATNRPEVLDPALLRAGRFDRQVVVDRPDKQGRVAILQVHIRKIALAEGVDLTQIADLTPGFTGAELANLCNEAALAATRRQAEAVTLEDFTVAVERIVAGLEKRNRVLSPLERETVAHHEMGHAIAAMSTPGSDPVHKVSIIPRGVGALGYTIQRPTEERYLMTRAELENRMVVLLGGRAAEEIIYGHFSTGASDDLQRVTQIARALVTRYGMHPDLGHVVYEKDQGNYLGQAMPQFDKPYSEETAREIDLAVRDIVQATYRRTLALLKARESLLRASAADLLARETLGEAELASIRVAAVAETTAGA